MRSLSAIEQKLLLVRFLIDFAREVLKRILQADACSCDSNLRGYPDWNCGNNDVDSEWINIVWIASQKHVDERHFRVKDSLQAGGMCSGNIYTLDILCIEGERNFKESPKRYSSRREPRRTYVYLSQDRQYLSHRRRVSVRKAKIFGTCLCSHVLEHHEHSQ